MHLARRGSKVTEQGSPWSAPSWLWLLVFLLGWLVIGQLAVGVLLLLLTQTWGPAPLLVTATLGFIAWFATGFAYAHGAPKGLWLTTLLGTLPLLGAAAAITSPGFPDGRLKTVPAAYWDSVGTFALFLGSMMLTVLVPVLAAWYASHRHGRSSVALPAEASSGI
jgi:hypothetical protein